MNAKEIDIRKELDLAEDFSVGDVDKVISGVHKANTERAAKAFDSALADMNMSDEFKEIALDALHFQNMETIEIRRIMTGRLDYPAEIIQGMIDIWIEIGDELEDPMEQIVKQLNKNSTWKDVLNLEDQLEEELDNASR